MQIEIIRRLITLLCFLAWENNRLRQENDRLRRAEVATRCGLRVVNVRTIRA